MKQLMVFIRLTLFDTAQLGLRLFVVFLHAVLSKDKMEISTLNSIKARHPTRHHVETDAQCFALKQKNAP